MTSVLGEVPGTLPALTRATQISERAAATGFDWTCIADIRAKIAEELVELDEALAASGQRNTPEVAEEFGDLLVALVNLSRHLRMDPEAALHAASTKFERRFHRMEAMAAARNRALSSFDAGEWDELWRAAKACGP